MASHGLGRVFISSVFGGMMEVRELAGEMCQRMALEPVMAERMPALSGSVKERLRREIEGCDAYLGVFHQRRGTVPASGTRLRAITEWEYVQARKLGLRCFVFLSTDRDGREAELQEFLDAEVTDFEGGVWARYYSTAEELGREVTGALAAARPRLRLTLGAGRVTLDPSHLRPAWEGPESLEADTSFELSSTAHESLRRFLKSDAYRRTILPDHMRVLGAELFEAALPGELGDAFRGLLKAAQGRLLVLEIGAEDGQETLLRLPWELLAPPGEDAPVSAGALEVVRRLVDGGPGKVPGDHLSVLGFTPSPLEDQIATAKRGIAGGYRDADLFWEREQENLLKALEPLLVAGRGRLVLPDDGAAETLRLQLDREDRPAILHLSCHGGPDEEGKPALFLEDPDGKRQAITSSTLQQWIRATASATPIELVVLSACYTAAEAPGSGSGSSSGERGPTTAPPQEAVEGEAPSPALEPAPEGTAVATFAEALVTGGIGTVLGMQTSVSDDGAAAFAGAFYAELAEGGDLPLAVRRGRSALGAKGAEHEWAIPVLLAAGPTGPLVAPRPLQSEDKKGLETVRDSVFRIGDEVYGEGYAGRRDFERRLARAVAAERRGTGRPVAIHGLGGMGKSTLAARYLLRKRAGGAHVWAVMVEETQPAAALLESIRQELKLPEPSGATEKEREDDLDAALRDRLRGEDSSQGERSYLLLDNFEVQQDEDGAFHDPHMAALLRRLKKLGGEHFGLLITSRRMVPGAQNLDLGELPRSAARKLKMKRPGLADLNETQWRAVLEHLGGHPKALELVGGYLLDHPEQLRQLVKRFETAREAVEEGLAREEQARGRKLLVQEVLDALPEERRPVFDRLCLLQAPLPTQELLELLEADLTAAGLEDGTIDPADALGWLRARGYLARTLAASALEGGELVHRLLADRWQGALGAREGEKAARGWHRRLAEALVQPGRPLSNYGLAAHHLDAAGERAGALELFTGWAIQLRRGHAYRACEQVARQGLERYPPGGGEEERVAAVALWQSVHDGLVPLGELEGAERGLDRAEQLLEGASSEQALFQRASVGLRKGRLLVGRGDVSAAMQVFERSGAEFKEAGAEKDQAIVSGELARLKAQSGDVPEALRLHEEELAIYERLGDVRSRAVTLGNVARLKAQSGDVSEALRLHEEELAIYKRLGDVRSRAVTLGDVARLKAQSGEVSEALRLLEEKLAIVERLGDVRERAVTLGDVARLKAQSGEVSEALRLSEEKLAIVERLGDVRERAVTLGDVAQLKAAMGERAEARALQEERLKVNRDLGDIDGIAAAQWDLARLALAEDDPADAIPRLAEAWQIFTRIGRADAIAFVGATWGEILAAGGQTAQALEVLAASEAAHRKLGWTEDADQVAAVRAQVAEQADDAD